MAITVGHDLEVAIDTILAGYVNSTSAALIGNLSPFVVAAVTLYFMMIGYNIMYGDSQDSVRQTMRKMFWTGFIISIALSAGTYQFYIIDGMNGLESDLLASLGVGGNLGSSFDNIIQPMMNVITKSWKASSFNIPQAILMACVVIFSFICLAIIVVVGLGSFILAKICLALVLAVGPFFLCMGIFPVTKKYMESWLGQCVQFVLVAILIGMTASIICAVTTQFATRVNNSALANPVVDTFAIDLVLLGCAFVASKIETLAAALSGGVGLADFSRGLAHFLTRERSLPQSDKNSSNQVNKPSMLRRGAGALGRGAASAGRGLGRAGAALAQSGASAVRRLYNSGPSGS